MWCIFLYLRAIFVATPTGEVSEVEILLRFDGVPEPALSSVFARTCSQQSVFFRVHPLSVRGPTFTCMRGSVIFSNMLHFTVYTWTTCVAPSRYLRCTVCSIVGGGEGGGGDEGEEERVVEVSLLFRLSHVYHAQEGK